ncbi:unnamed protein product [Dovyalis caffra]|uniref:Uncharacterized protein n=1 Tax=Dovyalis caffra TaxID=77055 RepID=A0AAV1RBS2_9ROSI|nr:unnamed protein product [Dovyalis caffra]
MDSGKANKREVDELNLLVEKGAAEILCQTNDGAQYNSSRMEPIKNTQMVLKINLDDEEESLAKEEHQLLLADCVQVPDR